jgi:1-acyl-sn-glycerol-3-phosphate acyltransferase
MLYNLVKALVKFALIILGLKSEGIHNLPKKGPIIVVANHVSNWDPLLVAVAMPRPIHFMAKAELYRNPLIARFLKGLNTIPVKRGAADRTAIHQALQILKEEKILGIFPEGTRNKTNLDSAGQLGAAMLP